MPSGEWRRVGQTFAQAIVKLTRNASVLVANALRNVFMGSWQVLSFDGKPTWQRKRGGRLSMAHYSGLAQIYQIKYAVEKRLDSTLCYCV